MGEGASNRSRCNRFRTVVLSGTGKPSQTSGSTVTPSQVSEMLHRNRAKIGFGMSMPLGTSTPFHLTLQPFPPGTGGPSQIFIMFIFLIFRTIFVLVDSALLHGHPGLNSRFFRVNVPNFWHALLELYIICAIFFVTNKPTKHK